VQKPASIAGSPTHDERKDPTMEALLTPAPPRVTRWARNNVWIGRILSGLAVAFLLVDAAMKLVPIAAVIEACQRLGYPADLARPIGVLLLACTALHVVPRSEAIGALLITAYLGGATATHVRIGDPFWFPIIMGTILWTGYLLRRPQMRAILLMRSRA
jgi:hypothetical protein